jgi:type IV pilus assembly protein PilQ
MNTILGYVRYVLVGLALALTLGGSPVLAQTATATDAGAMPNSMEDLQVTQQAGNTIVKITLRQALAVAPASFAVANPARVAFDFPGTANGLGKNSLALNEGDLRNVSIVQVADRTRLVMSLKRSATYESRLDGKVLYITFAPAVDSPADTPVAARFAESKPQETPQSVRDIKFRRGKNGEALIAVDLSDANVGIDIRQQGGALLVDFAKTSLPEHLRRRLDVTDFATPVTMINTVSQGDGVRINITPRGLWEHNAYQSDNQLVIEVKQIVEDPNKLVQGSRAGYQGEKLSLNFQDVDVRAVLQVISDFTNFNIVVSDSVNGKLTLRLKDVPWDQALDIILGARGLDMRKNGNVIWVAPRDELAAKEKLELESKMQISDLELTRTESFQLNYHKAKAVSEFLKNKDNSVLSKRGTLTVDERSNKVFVTDTPSRLDDVRRLIKEIDVAVRQVMIEARVVDADEGFAKKLGVRLGGDDHYGISGPGHRMLGNSGMRFGLSGSSNQAFVGVADATGYQGVAGMNSRTGAYLEDTSQKRFTSYSGTTGPDALQFVNLPVVGASGSVNLSLFNGSKTQMLNLELTALESDNRGKTISNPRVLTADQVEALIEQGDEIPYLTQTSSGATAVSFKKATLSLKVRPQITPDGRIMMNLEIHKDKVGAVYSGTPSINTKQVKTEVLVDNGGTVVIGGIYTQDERNDVTRTPLLGDLPYVGFLFRNTSKTDTRTELLVFITPRIVSKELTLN